MFDAGGEVQLDIIKENHPNDADKCTAEMLRQWLAKKPEASWNHLLKAFSEPHIHLNKLATDIEGMLWKGTYTWYLFYFIFIVLHKIALMYIRTWIHTYRICTYYL